jgi:hypothetical protein
MPYGSLDSLCLTTPNPGLDMKRILLLNAVLLVFFFAAWCVLDYFTVKSPRYPENCHDGEWTFIFIPLVTVVANLVAQRKQGLKKSVITAIVASVAVFILFLAMLIFPGMAFHWTIGGTL